MRLKVPAGSPPPKRAVTVIFKRRPGRAGKMPELRVTKPEMFHRNPQKSDAVEQILAMAGWERGVAVHYRLNDDGSADPVREDFNTSWSEDSKHWPVKACAMDRACSYEAANAGGGVYPKIGAERVRKFSLSES